MRIVDSMVLDAVVARREPRDLEGHAAQEAVVAGGLGLVERTVPDRDGDVLPLPVGVPARPRLDEAAPTVARHPAGQLDLAQPLEERDGPEPRLAQPAHREQAEPAVE